MRRIIKLTLLFLAVSPLLFAANYRFVKIDFTNSIETLANGINARGDIVGRYSDAEGVFHGFLLRKGVFSTIDFPGASFTAAFTLNARGDIAGHFLDANGIEHGFLLRDGEFTQIDFPGAAGTIARGISNAGDVVGVYSDRAGNGHGFLLKDGTFHTIHVPGSGGAQLSMVQDNGRVLVGSFGTPDGHVFGFVRTRPGEFRTINFPARASFVPALAGLTRKEISSGCMAETVPALGKAISCGRGNSSP
jgi:probable HAF family extracellular repeat protein